MAEYLSLHYQTIDEKGRIVLPGKLRRVAEQEAGTKGKITFFMRDCDGGLSLYTEAAWKPLRQHYSRFPNTTPEGRWAKRFFYMGVDQVICDRQGRITIPQAWRERAQLKGTVVVVGVGDHIEIWNAERFRRIEQERPAADSGEAVPVPKFTGESASREDCGASREETAGENNGG